MSESKVGFHVKIVLKNNRKRLTVRTSLKVYQCKLINLDPGVCIECSSSAHLQHGEMQDTGLCEHDGSGCRSADS